MSLPELMRWRKDEVARGATAPKVVMEATGHTHRGDPLQRFVFDVLHELGVPYQQIRQARVRLLARMRALLDTSMGPQEVRQFCVEVIEESKAAQDEQLIAWVADRFIECCKEVEQGVANGTFPHRQGWSFSIRPERIKI